MDVLTVRVEKHTLHRLRKMAAEAGTSQAELIRRLLTDDDRQPDDITLRIDEIRVTVIQIGAILAASVGKRSPELLEQGLEDGRILLEQRGLIERRVSP